MKSVVITGGEGDLAKSIAAHLNPDQYRVQSPGRDRLDVASSDSITSYFEDCGPVDLLINNAGTLRDKTLLKMSPDEWDEAIKVNLKGAFQCSQMVSRTMLKKRDGHIINIGSYSGLVGKFGQTNYAAAKAGLIGMTKSMAAEFGKRNVRVNCVLPGFLETKFTRNLPDKALGQALESHCLGRFNTVDDAGRFIAQLDTMVGISGQVFQLDSRITRWA